MRADQEMCAEIVSLRGVTILLVEDEPLIGLSVAEALSDAGANVLRTETDHEAYSVLDSAASGIDLLIVDVNLGRGTTGFDVARAARRLNPSIAVIYLSGGPAEWADAFGVEGALFASKPVLHDQLLAMAADLVKRGPEGLVIRPVQS